MNPTMTPKSPNESQVLTLATRLTSIILAASGPLSTYEISKHSGLSEEALKKWSASCESSYHWLLFTLMDYYLNRFDKRHAGFLELGQILNDINHRGRNDYLIVYKLSALIKTLTVGDSGSLFHTPVNKNLLSLKHVASKFEGVDSKDGLDMMQRFLASMMLSTSREYFETLFAENVLPITLKEFETHLYKGDNGGEQ